MPRARSGVARHRRKKNVFRRAKGYWGGRHCLYRTAKETLIRAEAYATRDRRNRKRDFRRLWVTRISAALCTRGLPYSRFIHGLKKARVDLNRKVISELAIRNPEAFDRLVALAQAEQ